MIGDRLHFNELSLAQGAEVTPHVALIIDRRGSGRRDSHRLGNQILEINGPRLTDHRAGSGGTWNVNDPRGEENNDKPVHATVWLERWGGSGQGQGLLRVKYGGSERQRRTSK